jgi:Fe-S cluster biogenesis protein NfuA
MLRRKGDIMKEKVQAVIDEIRPLLQGDGGDIELISVDEGGVVKVRLRGACAGCPGAQMTLKMAVERRLKTKVPEVQRVESV